MLTINGLTVAALLAAMASNAIAQDKTPAPPPAPAAPAAPAQPTPTLTPGSLAPEFKVEKFLKGDPITSFEKGKVYVVEFWATWCGPCIMSMPHLSELQHEYKAKGVTICGVNIWEDKDYSEATLTKAATFVEGKGDGMAYTVAFDGAAKHMDTVWMKAAGRQGIPSAFVVDKEGVIAWVGHPMQLDMVLDEVTSGTWSIPDGPAKIQVASKAFREAGAKYQEGLAQGDAAWAEATKLYPAMGRAQASEKFAALLAGKHLTEAYAVGNTLIEQGRAKKDISKVVAVIGAMTNPQQAPEKPDADLLAKAATAYAELSDLKQYGPHITLARVYFAAGDLEAGKASAAKATELAPAEVRERVQGMLKQFEEAAVKKTAGPN